MIRAIKILILYALSLVMGCAYIRNIPAEHSPVSVARYLRTQDLPNFAAGVGADLALRSICHGPTQHIAVRYSQRDSLAPLLIRRERWFSGEACPVARVAIVGGLGLVRRQTDRGYRESGVFMNLYGAGVTEILHFMVDAITKRWGPVR